MYMNKIISASLLALALASTSISISGCAYRPDLHQGNYTEQKDVNLLRVGMTKEQVKYVLGTPMLTDPMDHSKWYYINFLRQGWNDPEYKTLIAVFDKNGLLLDIYGDYEKPTEFFIPL